MTCCIGTELKLSITGLDRSLGLKSLGLPEFLDSRYMKVAQSSALCTVRRYASGYNLVLLSVRGWVEHRAVVWPEKLSENPNDPHRTRDLPARTVYEIMCKNSVEPERPRTTIWRMRFACWVPQVSKTLSEYKYFFLFHCNNGCTYGSQCYITFFKLKL
jgi:hypothetical protein